MCGIAGILNSSTAARANLERDGRGMANAITYRGPDDHVDLSPAGHQPMISADGRFVIVYNVEVYNFQELRPELEAHCIVFRGHSDTEVMLEAFAAYGMAPTIKQLIGMFAITV